MRRLSAPLLAGVLGACAGQQSVLDPAGEGASHLHGLFGLMMWICGAFYLLVLALLAWAIWRPRKGVPQPGNERRLRAGLFTWTVAIVAGLSVLATASFAVDRALAAARGRDAIEIRVTAHQWWWRVAYRDPASGGWIETANELHLPLGRTTRLELVAGDVIHSFWVPNLSGKLDVIPGRRNLLDITPQREGAYRAQCAEFCGLQHALMALDVRVVPPEQHAAWLAAQAGPATEPDDAVLARGRAMLEDGSCGACHTVRGTAAQGKAGPDLTHVGTRRTIAAGTLLNNRGNLQGWIVNPDALKPGTLMPAADLAPDDADALARYLEWLR